jgi:hypothetical protein
VIFDRSNVERHMERFQSQLKLGFEIVTSTQDNPSKLSPGPTIDFEVVKVNTFRTKCKNVSTDTQASTKLAQKVEISPPILQGS